MENLPRLQMKPQIMIKTLKNQEEISETKQSSLLQKRLTHDKCTLDTGTQRRSFSKEENGSGLQDEKSINSKGMPFTWHKSCATELSLNVLKGGQSPVSLQVHPD